LDENKKKPRQFSREFKLEALKRLAAKEKPMTQLAAELGVRRNMLVKWQEELRRKGDAAFRGAGRPVKSEQSELARLRAELERVTEERDILKKAAAYFAKRRR
jgi:transposase